MGEESLLIGNLDALTETGCLVDWVAEKVEKVVEIEKKNCISKN